WCQQPGDGLQAGVQCGQCARVTLPEAATGASDVPVGQVVDEVCELRAGSQRVVVAQCRVDGVDQLVELGEHPPVEDVAPLDRWCAGTGLPVVRPAVQGEERCHIPIGQQDLAGDLVQYRRADASRVPR